MTKAGDKYARITLLREVEKSGKDRMFESVCDCGKYLTVRLNNLRSGNTNSCGCYLIDKIRSPEVRKKISEAHSGSKSSMWKGMKASYWAKHIFLKNHFGKASKCENDGCVYPRYNSKGVLLQKPNRYHWANISGKYRRGREDYMELCPSCHKRYDMGIIKIKRVKSHHGEDN